jgi:hypothetical protein
MILACLPHYKTYHTSKQSTCVSAIMGLSTRTLIILSATAIISHVLDSSAIALAGYPLEYSIRAGCIFIIVGALMCAFAILAAKLTNYALNYIAATLTHYALNYFAEPDPDREEMEPSWRDAVAHENHALQKSASRAQSDLREKDRIIQRQREIIESLECRSAAHTRSIRGQLNLLKIKDSILVSKHRKIKYLQNAMFEKNMHIRNLQWDFESLEANIAWKDETLWVVTGSEHCALETIHNLQCNLEGCIKVLTWSDKSEAAAIDRLEKKYAPLLGQLSSKLDDAEKRLHKETADAKGLRAVIAKDVPYYIECIKVKDVALRNAEALLKKSEAERNILLDEKAKSKTQQLLEQAKNERNFANATLRLASRHKDYFKLEKEHESNLQAADYERRGFETQISNLENELSECKDRLTTVNTTILDRDAKLASALEAKEDLETQLKASTQRADENSLHLGFAKNALDNAINQLKTLNGECNAHKLAKKQLETAFNASQKTVAESHTSIGAQKESVNRYYQQLLKTEERYKDSVAYSAVLQEKLDTSKAQISTLQTQLSNANVVVSSLEEEAYIRNQIVAKAEGRAAASLADVKEALRIQSTTLKRATLAKQHADDRALAFGRALAEARAKVLKLATKIVETEMASEVVIADSKDKIRGLEARVAESNRCAEELLGRLGEETGEKIRASNEHLKAARLVETLKGEVLSLQQESREESRARETAEEGYVEVEVIDSGDEVDEDGSEGYYEDGTDGDDEDEEDEEDEKEEHEEFENVEVIEGREPVEGEEGFEFVESE